MNLEGGKDYSFLLRAPEQLDALLSAFQMRDPKGKLKPPTKEHPVYGMPAPELIVQVLARRDGPQLLQDTLSRREDAIYWMREDPLRHGYEPGLQDKRVPCWKHARELLKKYRVLHVTSRNRNGKTQFGAKWTAEGLTTLNQQGEPQVVWVGCEQEKTSKRGGGQQEVIWEHFPPEWREKKGMRGKNIDFSMGYSPGNKFSDNQCITPMKSELQCMNYKQDIDIIEGGAIDRGWFDEMLPIEWLLTLLFRVVDKDGHLLVSFTPKNGWDACYGHIYGGCRVVEDQPLDIESDKEVWPGLAKGRIPYIVEAVDKRMAGMIFPPDSNPFVPFADLLKQCEQLSLDQRLIRLAGVARNRGGSPFPKFGLPHILPKSKIPAGGTNFHFADFAWARNWANIWVKVIRVGGSGGKRRLYIYRDWPDKKTHGEWAEPSSKPGGKRGSAQAKIGLSVHGYIDLILNLEGAAKRENGKTGQGDNGQRPVSSSRFPVFPSSAREKFEAMGYKISSRENILQALGRTTGERIHQRYGDPRSGAAEAVTREESGVSYFDMLNEAGLDIIPVSLLGENRFIGEGIKQIEDLLDYDQDRYRENGNRFTPDNEPSLFISEECEQVIDCLRLWTPSGPNKDQACADFIDLLRYMAVEDLDDVGEVSLQCRGGGSY